MRIAVAVWVSPLSSEGERSSGASGYRAKPRLLSCIVDEITQGVERHGARWEGSA